MILSQIKFVQLVGLSLSLRFELSACWFFSCCVASVASFAKRIISFRFNVSLKTSELLVVCASQAATDSASHSLRYRHSSVFAVVFCCLCAFVHVCMAVFYECEAFFSTGCWFVAVGQWLQPELLCWEKKKTNL